MVAAPDAVHARRRLTNKLIAAHEAARLRPFFAPDVKVIVGDGSLILGVDDVIDAFAAQFAEPGFVAYQRDTQSVEVAIAGDRASERGRWIGRWNSGAGERTTTGDYLAVWRKATGQWIIESELYVTLA